MNKQLIIVLAVCLISVHAFVKREAPTTQGTNIESLSKTAGDLFEGFKETASRVINPEEVKKQLDAVVRTASQMFKDVQTRLQSVTSTNLNGTNTP